MVGTLDRAYVPVHGHVRSTRLPADLPTWLTRMKVHPLVSIYPYRYLSVLSSAYLYSRTMFSFEVVQDGIVSWIIQVHTWYFFSGLLGLGYSVILTCPHLYLSEVVYAFVRLRCCSSVAVS